MPKSQPAGAFSHAELISKGPAKTLKAAEAAGAQVLVPKTEIPNMGHYAVFLAPGEIPQGIFQMA